MHCSTPGFPIHHQFLELAQTHVHWVSDVIQPSHPLPSPSPLPSIFPKIRIFSESVLRIRWPKYWSFSFTISPSNECSGLTSFRIDWFDLFAVQGTLKSLSQHHSSKASILWHLAFFVVQLSHPYITTGKTIALTRWTFVDKVMSLLFNMMSKLVIEWLHFHFSLSCIGEGNSNSLQCSCLENPRDGEPGGLPSMGPHRVGHDRSNLAAASWS